MSHLKDAYSPQDGRKYEIIKIIQEEERNEPGPRQGASNHAWQTASRGGESYRRVEISELEKFTDARSEYFISHTLNDEGIREFKSKKIEQVGLNHLIQNHHHAISYLAERSVPTDVINAEGIQLPAHKGIEIIKGHVLENGSTRTNTAQYLNHAHMKNGRSHSPVLKDGSCQHAMVDNNTYTYEDGRKNEHFITSRHALDGKITDIVQPNGQIAWAKTEENAVLNKQRSTSIIDGVEQRVRTLPENILNTDQLKKLAAENTASFNPMRPAALTNKMGLAVL